MTRKPKGLPEFQSLLGKLVKVPKRELDRELAKPRKKAAKRKK
jgi:hypothetical protein